MTNYERIKQMSIEEMADNEVVKALGWLERLKRDTDVSEWAESIEIILNEYNRQKAEIERLSIESATLVTQLKGAYEQIHKLNMAKSEAIKEFAERLKGKLQWDVEFDNKLVFESDIDNLVKEMTEVNENDRA